MNVGGLSDEQYERLKRAGATGKYGHLESWKELFLFQIHYGSRQQTEEIGEWAEKANRGEIVLLPLMKNV